MSNTQKLRNCPFCGGDASAWYNGKNAHGGYWINIKCNICGVSMLGGISRNAKDPFDDSAYDIAVSRWNNRVIEEAE